MAGLEALDDLVMALSTRLLGCSADDLGSTIQRALGDLAAIVGADRAYVLKLSVEGRSVGDVFEEWWADDVEHRTTAINDLPHDAQRFWFRNVWSGQVVQFDDVEELAEQVPAAADALRADGVRSILFVPLMAQEAPVGFVGFEARRRRAAWAPSTAARIRIVGELVVTAVERCQGDVERAAIASDLADRNQELERSNQELQQFASVVSHDIRQPLTVMEGFARQLLHIAMEHPTKAELASRCGEAVERAGRQMRRLLEDVLAVARAGAPMSSFEVVDLGSLVDELVADLADEVAAAGATVTVGDLPVVEGSEARLRQVFQNLLDNALKFRSPDRAPVIDVRGAERGARASVTVTDNGAGIDAADRDGIFGMFVRAPGQTASGAGIGLAICERVVAAHGGTISVDASESGGCEFVIDLPRRQPTA
jgi:signal transduction histidine kinase